MILTIGQEQSTPMHNELLESLRCGVVGVVVQDERLLVIRRSLYVSAPNMLCFPGGTQEPLESEETTVVREFGEELSLPVLPLAPLWRCVARGGLELSWWQVAIVDGAVPVPAPAEVSDVYWMPANVLEQQPDLLPTNRDFLAAWRCGAFVLDGLSLDRK